MSLSSDNELESYDTLSHSLTFTKPSSKLTGSDECTYGNQSDSYTPISSTSCVSESIDPSGVVSYSEDFTPYSADRDDDFSQLTISGTNGKTSTSLTTTSASSIKLPESSAHSRASHGDTDTYGSDFHSISQHTSGSSPQEHSRTPTALSDATSSYTAGYSSDFDSAVRSSASGYSSDFETSSSTGMTSDVKYTSYSGSRDSTGGYTSDFESTAADESDASSRHAEQTKQSELAYVKAVMRALQSTDDGNKNAADRAIDEAAMKLKRDAQQSLPVRNYIARCLYNLQQSSDVSMATDSVDESQPSPMKSSKSLVIPADHGFVYRVERLRAENIIAALKEKGERLNIEIREHEELVEKGMPPHNARRFALPIKLRLEKEVFQSTLADHQMRMNTVSMIGEIARDLPKPTERPKAIWDQLMNTAQRRTT